MSERRVSAVLLLCIIFILPSQANTNSNQQLDKPLLTNPDSIESLIDNIYDVDQSKRNTQLALAIESAKAIGNNDLCCKAALKMRNYNYDQSDMLLKYKYINEATRNNYCSTLNEKAKIYNTLGNSFYDFGKYEQALQAFFSSAKYYHAENNKKVTIPLGNISEVYSETGKYQEAINYTEEALVFSTMFDSPDKELNLTYDYYRLTAIYMGMEEYEKAERYINLSLQNVEKLDKEDFSLEYFDTYTTAIKLYLKKGDKFLANKYLQKAKEVVQDYNIETLKYYEAQVAHAMINYDKSFRLIRSIDVDQIQLYSDKIKFLEFKKSILVQIANYDKALLVSEEMRRMEKENFSNNSARTFALADVEYEIQKSKAAVENLNERRKEDQVTIKKQRVSTFLVAFLLLLIAGFALSLYLQNKRKKQTIEAQKILEDELRNKSIEIEKSRQDALSASQAKQDFLSTMSHEIRTPMNAVLGLTNLLLDEMPRDDQKKHLGNIKFSGCLLYTSPSPRDATLSRMPSSA